MNPRKNSQEFLRKGAIVRITNKIILIILRKFERIATPVPGQKNNSSEDFRCFSSSKKILGLFRLRSNSGVFSSSIFDCTAHNAAYCDAGNGTPQEAFAYFLNETPNL